MTSELIAEWDTAAALLEGVLATTLAERYVLGFSNGGHFAAYIGLEELWTTAGAGLVAAGRSNVGAFALWMAPELSGRRPGARGRSGAPHPSP